MTENKKENRTQRKDEQVERQTPYVQKTARMKGSDHSSQGGMVGGGSASSSTTGSTTGGPVSGGGTPSGSSLPEYKTAASEGEPELAPQNSEPMSEPGQGEDLTQAGEVLYREIKQGKVHPENSTPKTHKKSAA